LAPFPRTEYAVKVNRQEYYAIITHADAQVGRILDALERSGEADNTYIFFTADHGLACGHHGLMGKQNMYDHSVRVPFFVVGPDVPEDKQMDARIYLQDVMPTTLELAGVKTPEHVQFKSLLPLIQGKTEQTRDAIYGGYTKTQRMITVGDYKLIVYPSIGRKLLFDLKNDPLEISDLAGKPEYAGKIAELTAKLKALQPEVGDTLDLGIAQD
jgi:choline-sulfatase